jgi:hypothetical protein
MPKVKIYFHPQWFANTFPKGGTLKMAFLADEILKVVSAVILDQMKGRTDPEWTAADMKMEAKSMEVITTNRHAVEVEIVSTNGPHWQEIKVSTQQKLNSALRDFLVIQGLTFRSWKGSAWVQLVDGSYGDTDQAAQRDAAATLNPPI